VGPGGHLASYRKIHLFGMETAFFLPGDRPFSTCDVGGVRVGIMICFDHLFPEAARSLALLGADVIAHPANLVLPGVAQRTMEVRALENGIFAATANRVGSEARNGNELRYTGQSQIVGPNGNVLVRLSEDRPEIAVVEIDISRARDKAVTSRNDKLADRRPHLYTLDPAA
jgi:predicted amidohydrolase